MRIYAASFSGVLAAGAGLKGRQPVQVHGANLFRHEIDQEADTRRQMLATKIPDEVTLIVGSVAIQHGDELALRHVVADLVARQLRDCAPGQRGFQH